MTNPFDKGRSSFSWIINETKQCIFHIAKMYEMDNNIIDIINGTEKRHELIANILKFDFTSIKKTEKRQKYNYWFYSPEILSINGIIPDDSFKGTGSVGNSGIDYVVFNDKWSNHIEHIFHEETHLLVKCEIGEAPSLLNEGIAVYTESIVYSDQNEFFRSSSEIWNKNISLKNGILQKLMTNDFFWSKRGELPVYRIGAAFVYFLVKEFGIEIIKNIFEDTHYDDCNLCSIIESQTQRTIDTLEIELANFYK